ncbi:MAG: DUF433 domain-containing protein [Chloroflexota bacterium]|nr:DUF433 domain-containing protein [Chloroflexota bacterium]
MSAVASYVHLRDGEYFVGESRVTLHSVVASWKRGEGPERIQQAFPSLPLVAIYGAITYYLERQAELDANFAETERLLAAHQANVEAQNPEFFANMRARLASDRAEPDSNSSEQSGQ